MGGAYNGCGSGLLGVTSNKLATFSPDKTAYVFQAHVGNVAIKNRTTEFKNAGVLCYTNN